MVLWCYCFFFSLVSVVAVVRGGVDERSDGSNFGFRIRRVRYRYDRDLIEGYYNGTNATLTTVDGGGDSAGDGELLGLCEGDCDDDADC